ncbi:hypothetical protein B0T18DRAFT_412779 [Schizothecium vesticola]|uniref:Uncharacterized protein n=1 Tax=Schizothecium vesticola TaxID=314040 RepID=A0AA40EWM5_9PEZI|nr:hypothetical protein B0T18DRAFT_412779 [Schizothecium vesticola]
MATNNTTPLEFSFNGNSDLTGLGLRLSFYINCIALALAAAFLNQHFDHIQSSGLAFSSPSLSSLYARSTPGVSTHPRPAWSSICSSYRPWVWHSRQEHAAWKLRARSSVRCLSAQHWDMAPGFGTPESTCCRASETNYDLRSAKIRGKRKMIAKPWPSALLTFEAGPSKTLEALKRPRNDKRNYSALRRHQHGWVPRITATWTSPRFDWNWSANYATQSVNASDAQSGGGVYFALQLDQSSFPAAPVNAGGGKSFATPQSDEQYLITHLLAPVIMKAAQRLPEPAKAARHAGQLCLSRRRHSHLPDPSYQLQKQRGIALRPRLQKLLE